MKTKLFTLLLAVAAGVGTMFASDTSVDGIWYNFDSGTKTAEVTYRGSDYYYYSDRYTGVVVIPASVTYYDEVYSVTSIGNSAFYRCSGLTSVTIPSSVTSIGESAFSGCSGLTSVTIPSSVTSIGERAFSGCSGSTSFTVTINNPNFSSLNGVLFNKDKTTLIQYPCAKQGDYIIPNSVTSVGVAAFVGCINLTSVTIPNSVTSIGDGAFYGCSGLTSIEIPNSVTNIGVSALSWCTGLTSVTIPNNVTSIGKEAFHYCTSLTSVTIPSSVTSIGDGAFAYCTGLTSVHISDLAAWCAISFRGSAANPLLYAHNLYLNGTLVTDLVIPNDIVNIGEYAFISCTSLTSVTIGNSVTIIGVGAFMECASLTSVTIPNSVTIIGGGAFMECASLTSLNIGNSVTSIGEAAFYGCTGLTSITCEAVIPPTLGIYIFEDVNKSIPLYVPAASISAYESADQWKDFYNILPIGSQGIEAIVENRSQDGKFIHDGQIFILRGEKVYTLQGQEVK